MRCVSSSRLLSFFAERTAAAALSLANHLCAFLAGCDAVSIAFEHFLGGPSDDCHGAIRTVVELFGKLCLKLLNECHCSF
jgi:hypothetical protein